MECHSLSLLRRDLWQFLLLWKPCDFGVGTMKLLLCALGVLCVVRYGSAFCDQPGPVVDCNELCTAALHRPDIVEVRFRGVLASIGCVPPHVRVCSRVQKTKISSISKNKVHRCRFNEIKLAQKKIVCSRLFQSLNKKKYMKQKEFDAIECDTEEKLEFQEFKSVKFSQFSKIECTFGRSVCTGCSAYGPEKLCNGDTERIRNDERISTSSLTIPSCLIPSSPLIYKLRFAEP